MDYECEECFWIGDAEETYRKSYPKEGHTLHTVECPECEHILIQGEVEDLLK